MNCDWLSQVCLAGGGCVVLEPFPTSAQMLYKGSIRMLWEPAQSWIECNDKGIYLTWYPISYSTC